MSRHEGRYDLHMHTNWSDGTDSVADIVAQVAERKLAGFSITDHDTAASQPEAQLLAGEFGLSYITGIELSVTDGPNDLHILVYGYDLDHDELKNALEQFRDARRSRAIGMAQKLRELGCPIDIDNILREAGERSVGRPHLARALVETGSARNVRDAFELYLAAGRPAYLPKFQITPAEGIALARRARGVTVLAHPASYPFKFDLAALAGAGLQGLETSYPSWDNATTSFWRAQAREYHLLESGGSDFHGSHRPGVEVGSATISPEMFQRILTARG
jgi:hypothetical protein